MNCKFCNEILEPWQSGTMSCNNCWEVFVRITRMPSDVVSKIIVEAQRISRKS